MTTETTAAKPSGLKKAATFLMWAALAAAVLGYPAAYAIDKGAGRDVVILKSAADASTVEAQREQFDDSEKDPVKRREAIVEIYGSSPKADIERVLFVSPADVIEPKEDPSFALLKPKADGSQAIQAKSAYFAAKLAAMAGGGAFLALLILRRFLR
jgi:hypothetical protein